MLSGVGPKEELEQFGIPVIYDSPYVGKNLQVFFERKIKNILIYLGPTNSLYLFQYNTSTYWTTIR